MSDPLQQQGPAPPLFQPGSTSQKAGQQAAINSGQWRQRILHRLELRPSTLWEIADFFEVPDHTISGRFTELARDGYIERTGERRPKPETGCDADVWALKAAPQGGGAARALTAVGYPLTLIIDGELYDRQELLPSEGYPGIPYARRADTGGLRQLVRVEILECPGCGKPLRTIIEGKSKRFQCGTPTCNKVWHGATPSEPGGPPLLALVMKTS